MHKYILFLFLLASCNKPHIDNSETLTMHSLQIQALVNRSVSDSIKIADLGHQVDTLNAKLQYVNAKTDTALICIGNIDKKALRRYNTAHFISGAVDALTGGKVGAVMGIFKKK